MKSRRWMRAGGAVALAMSLLAAGLAHATGAAGENGPGAAPPAAAGETDTEKPAAADAKPAPRDLEKVRQGSLLRRDEPLGPQVDLRGDFEKRRDREVVSHYTRLAELDVIEALAQKADDVQLLDRVEEVRRKEKQRFWMVMRYLREVAQEKAMRGNR